MRANGFLVTELAALTCITIHAPHHCVLSKPKPKPKPTRKIYNDGIHMPLFSVLHPLGTSKRRRKKHA